MILLFCLAIAPFSIGCNGSLGSRVVGTATLDGKPLPYGGVSFHPVASGPVATAAIQSDGTFELKTGKQKSLPPGDYRVTVVAVNTIPPTTKQGMPSPGEQLVPSKYGSLDTTELRVSVKPGRNVITLEMSNTE